MMKAFSLPGFEDIDPELRDQDTDDSEDDIPEPVDITSEYINHHQTEHQPCFAHTLQLVMKDGLNNAGPVNKVLAKRASILAHVRRSTHASDILEEETSL